MSAYHHPPNRCKACLKPARTSLCIPCERLLPSDMERRLALARPGPEHGKALVEAIDFLNTVHLIRSGEAEAHKTARA